MSGTTFKKVGRFTLSLMIVVKTYKCIRRDFLEIACNNDSVQNWFGHGSLSFLDPNI